jgi:hypothetical protein
MGATSLVRVFAAIACNEVVLNSKRVAPYAVMIVCSVAALMGWVRGGPAVALGWATNSDFYIARGLKAFSFTALKVPRDNSADVFSRDCSWSNCNRDPTCERAYADCCLGVCDGLRRVARAGIVFMTSIVAALNVLLRNGSAGRKPG